MKKILVVEDNIDLNEILKRRLESSGFTVDAVESGYAVLSYLKSGKVPDAVILDLMLPGRSGLELLDTLVTSWAATKIFIFSAHSEHEERHTLKNYGISGYFCKSDGIDKLIDAIRAELEGSDQENQL